MALSEAWLANYEARRAGAVRALASIQPAKQPIILAPVPSEQNTISLALSAPPSVNAMYANVPGKGRVRSTVYRQWRRAAMTEALVGMAGKARIVGPFVATLRISARGDLDGRIKSAIDICKTVGAIVDDRYLVELHVYRQGGPGGIWIELRAAAC